MMKRSDVRKSGQGTRLAETRQALLDRPEIHRLTVFLALRGWERCQERLSQGTVMAEAQQALEAAADAFDPELGVPFIRFAKWRVRSRVRYLVRHAGNGKLITNSVIQPAPA